jgi:transcriptional regulator GlxA family with amidase domain
MNVGVLLFHEVSELEAVVPYGLLAAARTLLDDPKELGVCTIAKSRNSVQTAGAMTITPTWAFMSAPAIDTLIIPGGPGVEAALKDRALKLYLQTRKGDFTRVITIGSGVLIAGENGFLCDQVIAAPAALYDRVEGYEVASISSDRVVKNSQLWCASVSSAAQEMTLALIQDAFAGVYTKLTAHLGIPVRQTGLFEERSDT